MRKRGRPAAEFPYVNGPYKHRARWRVIVIRGRRGNGARDAYHETFTTRPAAVAFIRNWQRIQRAQGRTVEDAVKEYIAHQTRRGNKSGTIKTTGYRLAAILDYSMPLIDLTPRNGRDLYDDLVDEGGAVDTHHGCLIQARAFGRFCVSNGWLQVNPFEGVEAVGKKSRGKEQLRLDEARTYSAYCLKAWRADGDRSAIAALLPLLMNLRASEVAQLTARDVDNRGRLLWIAEEDGKSDAARRRALIPKVLVPAMVDLAASPVLDGRLFALDGGDKPADRHWVSRTVRRYLDAAGVPGVTTHGLRGVHATLATVEGVTGDAVARAMGHTDPGMTQRHYIDADAAADAQTERVEAALIGDDDGELNE